MNREEALSQFISIKDDTKCSKCYSVLNTNNGKYFYWGIDSPKVQVCENCFDKDIKKRWNYF